MKSNATALAVVLLGLICLVGIVSVVECANSATDAENLASVLSQSLRRKHTVAKRLQGKLQTKHHARVQKAVVKVKSFVQDIVRPFLNTVMRVVDCKLPGHPCRSARSLTYDVTNLCSFQAAFCRSAWHHGSTAD